jgi:hypothetical protein
MELHSIARYLEEVRGVAGPVRGTPALPAFPAISPASGPVSGPVSGPASGPANAPDFPPARSRWHVLCDQARDHCRYLRTRATG